MVDLAKEGATSTAKLVRRQRLGSALWMCHPGIRGGVSYVACGVRLSPCSLQSAETIRPLGERSWRLSCTTNRSEERTSMARGVIERSEMASHDLLWSAMSAPAAEMPFASIQCDARRPLACSQTLHRFRTQSARRPAAFLDPELYGISERRRVCK